MGDTGMLCPVLKTDSLENLEDVVAKVLQECQNGLPEREFRLPTEADWASLRARIGRYAESVGAVSTVRDAAIELRVPRAGVTIEPEPRAIVVRGQRAGCPALPCSAATRAPAEDAEIWQLVTWMTELLPRTGALDAGEQQLLEGALKHRSWLVATLASDVLNRAGQPAVPRFVRDYVVLDEAGGGTGAGGGAGDGAPGPRRDGVFTEAWEARISVDEYALYEAVHPAYAVQMVELGRMVRRYGRASPDSLLDVGSGPGLPTVMLAEMFPGARIEAVEPSPAAFPHLVRNCSGHAISAHNTGITEFEGRPLGHPVSVSVGASHHLDTRLFLRGLKRHTVPGGLIVVADEMIAPFSSLPERTRAIIDHHFVYIDQAVAHVREEDLPRAERVRLRALRDRDRRTPERLPALLEEVRRDRVTHTGEDGPWQRVRFCVLELEALVAGVDYDVERKTYPENFLELARDEGLEPLEHHRVHATVGGSHSDAGTHVFALRNPGRYL